MLVIELIMLSCLSPSCVERQSGSHIQLQRSGGRRLTVPRITERRIKQGVMKSIFSQAHTTQEEFLTHF